jgi:hypothetical protein
MLNISVSNVVKLTKKESLELFERVISMIKKQKRGFFYFKKLKGVHGYCEWEDGIILDYRKDLVPTIIHECIHYIEPDWSEAQVMYAESRVVNSIIDDDVIRLLLYFVKKI